jgi:hypothetical protein
MPFTISHAAAMLPFSRPLARWRVLSAAVIGSMVPDFGFLMPWRPLRVDTHSAIGLLTFCLPVGLATFWIYQRLIKSPIMAVLPNSAYGRWRRFGVPADIGSLKQWILSACGVLVGATSHLVWDAFTHEGARGVRMIPVLDDPVVDFAGHRLQGLRVLQDVSSLVGLTVVLAIIAYGLRGGRSADALLARPLAPRERYAWIAAYLVVAALLGGLFWLRHPPHPRSQSLPIMVGNCSIAALRGCATGLLGVSLCLGLRLRANP